MGNTETKQIEVRVFRTPEGEPTCASNFTTGDVCKFVMTQRFGTEHVCFFDPIESRGLRLPLEASKHGQGFLIPCAHCPLQHPKS